MLARTLKKEKAKTASLEEAKLMMDKKFSVQTNKSLEKLAPAPNLLKVKSGMPKKSYYKEKGDISQYKLSALINGDSDERIDEVSDSNTDSSHDYDVTNMQNRLSFFNNPKDERFNNKALGLSPALSLSQTENVHNTFPLQST